MESDLEYPSVSNEPNSFKTYMLTSGSRYLQYLGYVDTEQNLLILTQNLNGDVTEGAIAATSETDKTLFLTITEAS